MRYAQDMHGSCTELHCSYMRYTQDIQSKEKRGGVALYVRSSMKRETLECMSEAVEDMMECVAVRCNRNEMEKQEILYYSSMCIQNTRF